MVDGQASGATLVFLDIDGVVCCNFHGELEGTKLALVKDIVDATGAKVVLSSDWRRRPDLRQRAEAALAAHGVDCIGATPEYPMYDRVRPKEILAWMDCFQHPISGWVAIDDRDLVLEEGGFPAFKNHFVLTEFHSGLTPQLVRTAIARLRNGQQHIDADDTKPALVKPALAKPDLTTAAAGQSDAAGPQTLVDLGALLHECSLSHLEPCLHGETHDRLILQMACSRTSASPVSPRPVPRVAQRRSRSRAFAAARR